MDDLDGEGKSCLVTARCMISIQMGEKTMEHPVLVVRGSERDAYVAADVLHRMAAQVDFCNEVMWSRLDGNPIPFQNQWTALKLQLPLPYAVLLELSQSVKIPSGVQTCPVPLRTDGGHPLFRVGAFVSLLQTSMGRGLCAPQLSLINSNEGSLNMLVDSLSSGDIRLERGDVFAVAIDPSYYTVDLEIPIIGQIPGTTCEEEDTSVLW
ncbi:MAG: hypothetical protein RSB88_08440 [Akkermansia sp.]